jgi:PAS domain S-box-containing protein
LVRLPLKAALILIVSISAYSQSTLQGRITDPFGAVIVDATVNAVRSETSEQRTAKTDREGLYQLAALPVQLKRWGIAESRLLEGSILNFKDPTFWVQYKWHIIGVLGVVTIEGLLIIYLLIERRRRRLVREALSESEARLTLALEAGEMGAWEWNTKTNDLKWSQEHYKIMGIEPNVRLTYDTWAAQVHPDDLGPAMAAANQMIMEKGQYCHEYRIIRPDGTLRWVEVRGEPMIDESGNSSRMLGLMVDITDRKRAELRRQTQYSISQVLSQAVAIEEAAPKLIQSICECLDWEFGELWLVEPRIDTLIFLDCWHQPSQELAEFASATRKLTFARGVALPGRVWKDQQPIWIPDLIQYEDSQRHSLAKAKSLHGAFGFPLYVGSQTVGVMVFFSREPREPDQDLLQMTSSIGSQIGQFVKSKRADAALRESEERNRAILRAIPDLIFLQSKDGVYLDFHAKDAERLFVPPEKFLGKTMDEVLPPELAAAFHQCFQRALETGETQIWEYYMDLNGERSWFEARMARCNGSKLMSVVRDITVRKQAEQTTIRRARHAALRADLNAALTARETGFQGSLQITAEALVRHLDAALARIWLMNKDENTLELQASAGLYTHVDGPHSRVPVGELKIGMIASEREPNLTNHVIGDPRVSNQEWAKENGLISFAGYPLLIKERVVGVIAMFARHELTNDVLEAIGSVADSIAQGIERKRAEEELSISEQRFVKAFEANPQPMSLTTLDDGRYLDVNESFLIMSGFTREEVIGHTSLELGNFDDPGQRDSFVAPLKEKGSIRNFETNFRTRNGDYRVLLLSAELLELGGQPCILVASSDITQRKRLEEELRQSEREFSTLVENSPDVISRLDRDLRFIYISPALERNSELTTTQFLGRSATEVNLPGHNWENFASTCHEVFETGEAITREFSDYGHSYRTRVIPELSSDGAVESLMCISEDVTERVRSERELLELTARLFTLQDEERRRIARELHDGTAQNLFAISINLAQLKQRTTTLDTDSIQLLDECQSLGDQSLKEMRTLSYLLHPPLLDQAGLVSALRWYVEGFSKRSGIYVDVRAQDIGRLSSEVETALFRIVQESLSNVRRHSGSETASVRLERRMDQVVLEVRDNGRGLPMKDNDESTNDMHDLGVGIPGMRQRLRQLGGRLEIKSDDAGTAVIAIVPLNHGAQYGAHSAGR